MAEQRTGRIHTYIHTYIHRLQRTVSRSRCTRYSAKSIAYTRRIGISIRVGQGYRCHAPRRSPGGRSGRAAQRQHARLIVFVFSMYSVYMYVCMFVFMNTRMSRNGRASSPQLGHVVQHAHDDQAAHTDSGFHGEPAQANTTLNLST